MTTTHRLSASQTVPRPIDEVFSFFSRPQNLARITPATLGFERVSDDTAMRTGLEIEYRIRPLLRVPLRWRTRIEAYDPPAGFIDVQLSGPYRRWEHRHTFTPVPGGTRIDDEVSYELPFGAVGEAAHRLAVQGELEAIFRHRARIVADIFAQPATIAAPLVVGVAGGTGFVGGAIASELHRRGHRVVVLSHRGEAARGGLPDDVEIRPIDVRDGSGLPGALEGLDALVIALAFPNSPIEAPRRGRTFVAIDAEGTARLVNAAAERGVSRLLYVSGAGASPDARRHWFRAKWQAEESVRGATATWTIIRPTWIYGPRDVSLNRFVSLARRLGVVPLPGSGRQRLAPVFIDDVARLAADALVERAAEDQVFELGGPDELSMREVVRQALSAAGLRRPVIPGPAALIKLAAWPLRLLPEPPLTPAAVDFINQPATVDPAPLLARMPRRLTPIDEGLVTYLPAGSGPGRLTFERARSAHRERPLSRA